jgi:hypothetical protein
MPDASLEEALARTEGDADASLKAAATVASSLKRLRAAARVGDLREIRRGLESAGQAIAALEQQFATRRMDGISTRRPISPVVPTSRS